MQKQAEWILCPVCGNKTRDRTRYDTVLKNYPLYCPKCKQETLIEAENLKVTVIYNGWENIVVPVGEKMLSFIMRKAGISDIAETFDKNQYLLSDNADVSFTTAAEKIDNDHCAKLVGIVFAKASGADMALISKNKWYNVEHDLLNSDGVSGNLFPLPVTEQEITSILPTGWRGNIQTLKLSGAKVKELCETGAEIMAVDSEGKYYTQDGLKGTLAGMDYLSTDERKVSYVYNTIRLTRPRPSLREITRPIPTPSLTERKYTTRFTAWIRPVGRCFSLCPRPMSPPTLLRL